MIVEPVWIMRNPVKATALRAELQMRLEAEFLGLEAKIEAQDCK